MGRPINHRYLGNGNLVNYAVLRPIVQLRGIQEPAWMLRQTGSNKFFCRQIYTGYSGICEFAQVIERNNQMILRYRNLTLSITGSVARLTNLLVRDFSGNSLPWTLSFSCLALSPENLVYISDNSLEP